MKLISLLILVFFSIVSIHAQIIDIPDPNFKDALVNTNCVDFNLDNVYESDADTNDDGEIQLSEAQAVLGLAIPFSDINSLEGIENFENLTRIDCSFNSIDNLDLSNNVNLEVIFCDFNDMSSLNITNLINLKDLTCEENSLTNLDLSDNISLEELQCDVNQLVALDLSSNSMLLEFSCVRNSILNLDLSNNINLERAAVGSNLFTSLDLTNNINLELFYCRGNTLGNVNQLTSIDLSNNSELRFLSFTNSPNLTSINLKNGSNLDESFFNLGSNSIGLCPNLSSICVDSEELDDIQILVDAYGYTNCEVTTECTNLSIEEYAFNTINIYPNPVREKLFIDSKYGIHSIAIYNINGVLVKELSSDSKLLEINIEDLSTGVYFLKVDSEIGFYTSKIIKN